MRLHPHLFEDGKKSLRTRRMRNPQMHLRPHISGFRCVSLLGGKTAQCTTAE